MLACGGDGDKGEDDPAASDPAGRASEDAGIATPMDGGSPVRGAGEGDAATGASRDAGSGTLRSSDGGEDRGVITPVGNVDESIRALCEVEASDGSNECDQCTAVQCCNELAKCLENNECYELTFCSGGCEAGDQACLTRCATRYAGGAALAGALTECGKARCASRCPAAP